MAQTNSNFMNGVPELLILRLLQSREMYGYELVQAIQAETKDAIKLGEGVVYPVLHALERKGVLKSRRKAVNGRTRVYYTVTKSGTKHMAELLGQWQRIAAAITTVTTGDSHVAASV